MLRKRKIKAIYINEVICDKCGRPMEDSGRIALTDPAKYIFQCLHCHMIGYLREDQKYEIEFEDIDAPNSWDNENISKYVGAEGYI